jgi:hypothetical protein
LELIPGQQSIRFYVLATAPDDFGFGTQLGDRVATSATLNRPSAWLARRLSLSGALSVPDHPAAVSSELFFAFMMFTARSHLAWLVQAQIGGNDQTGR